MLIGLPDLTSYSKCMRLIILFVAVMPFEGNDRDDYTFILNAVNQAVTFVYLTAPKPGQIAFQLLDMARTCGRMLTQLLK